MDVSKDPHRVTEEGPPFSWPDDSDFPEFDRRWRALVRSICNKARLQSVDAADIAQSVMVALLEKRKLCATFPSEGRFIKFVTKTTKGRISNLIRARTRHETGASRVLETVPFQRDTSEFLDRIPIDVPADGRFAWLTERAGEHCREVLALKWGEDMTFGEIGHLFGVAQSTAHDLYKRCLKKLRSRLPRD